MSLDSTPEVSRETARQDIEPIPVSLFDRRDFPERSKVPFCLQCRWAAELDQIEASIRNECLNPLLHCETIAMGKFMRFRNPREKGE